MTSRRYPREPGSAIVLSASRCRVVVPAQWRTRHPAARHHPSYCGGSANLASNGRAVQSLVRRVDLYAGRTQGPNNGLRGTHGQERRENLVGVASIPWQRHRARARARARQRIRSRFLVSSSSAFWAAHCAPASHGQRGHMVGIGRMVTTLPARRRPPGELGEMFTAPSPWSARCDNVREATRCRRASEAHCQTPHSR